MSTNWDDEVNRYRQGSAIKRMSVVGNQLDRSLGGKNNFQPSNLTFSKTMEDDDDYEDDDDDGRPTLSHTSSFGSPSMITPSILTSTMSMTQDETVMNTIPQNHHNHQPEIDPDEQWVELCATTDIGYRLYYNKHTKETTFFRPTVLGDDEGNALAELEFKYLDQDVPVVDKLRHHMEKISKHIEYATQLAAAHPTTVDAATTESLKTLKIGVNQVNSTLLDVPQVDPKNNVLDYLIGTEHSPWDFTNPSSLKACAYYRATTTKTDHKLLQFNAWHVPEYFSTQPLLPGTNRIRLHVSLPQSEMDSTSKGPFQHAKRVLMDAKLDEKISSVIYKAYMKLYRTTPTNDMASQYVLKAVGYSDYMLPEPDLEIGVYAYIRKCLRDLQDPELLLCKKPEPTIGGLITPKRIEDAQFYETQYNGKIDSNIELLERNTYADLIDVHAFPHDELSKLTYYPQNSIQVPFHVQIIGIDNITVESVPRLASIPDCVGLYIKAVLIHGSNELPWNYETSTSTEIAETLKFNEMFYGNAQSTINNLPRETRIGFVLMARRMAQIELQGNVENKKSNVNKDQQEDDKDEKKRVADVPLAWVVNNIINYQGEMISGIVEHSLWVLPRDATHKKAASQRKRDVDPQWLARSCNIDNFTKTTSGPAIVKLHVKYPTFQQPVVAPLVPLYIEPNIRIVGSELTRSLDKQHSAMLLRVLESDPLYELTHEIKTLLWNSRHYLIDVPKALPKVIQCVDWTKADMRNEMYRLLSLWSAPLSSPIDIIELLDIKYADYQVREYAVNTLRLLNDEDLQLYLLQLVQCIKYEPYHDSPLSRFLIERAIASPYQIGHSFYWHLKAEVHDPQNSERFACILEELLSHVGIFIDELYKQCVLVHKFQQVADQIIRFKREYDYSDDDTTIKYHELLRTINTDILLKWERFQIPLNPKWEAKGLLIEKCRFMSSKMVPLWLVFENADPDGAPIVLIFKSGDDLRQDLLTLQILRVMDRLWLQHGLDMRLKPYGVIATGVNEHGEGVGMIEVVLNSDTTSSIQVKYGGGARGALKLEPIDSFIREHNPQNEMLIPSHIQSESLLSDGGSAGTEQKKSISKYTAAVDNFVRSCAGYCVATFVLGIGDRHNGNIMVTKSGHLFHIDFGHFLGNFKSKFGINRERARFVFTPEMAYVMGGKDYKNSEIFKQFKNISSKSFRILREYSNLIEVLFELMVVAGMPELSTSLAIHYLRDQLCLDVDAKTAQKELLDEIKKSLDSTYRRIDNMIHNWKHQ